MKPTDETQAQLWRIVNRLRDVTNDMQDLIKVGELNPQEIGGLLKLVNATNEMQSIFLNEIETVSREQLRATIVPVADDINKTIREENELDRFSSGKKNIPEC